MVSSKFRTVECEHQHISYLFQRVIGHIYSYPIGFIFGTDILQGIPWGQMFGFFNFEFFFLVLKLGNFECQFDTLVGVRWTSNFAHFI